MEPALLDSHARLFAPMRRERGQQLFDARRVDRGEVTPDEVSGTVFDGPLHAERSHEVYLMFEDGELDVSCDCRGPEYCEHGYALLLAEQARRSGVKPGRRAVPAPSPSYASPPRPKPTPVPAVTPPRPTAPDWRKRLRDAEQDLDGPMPPPRERQQPMYVIEARASRTLGRLRVHVMLPSKDPATHTEFELRSLRSDTNQHAFPELDQHLLQLLAAARGSPFHEGPPGMHTIDARWAPIVVPKLFETGRVCHLSSFDEEPAALLVLDPGEAFAFRTRLERTADAVAVHGQLVRGDETLSWRDVNAVLDGGFVLLRQRMVRARFGHATSLARALLQDGPLTTAPRDERELIGTLLEMTGGDSEIAPPVPTRPAGAPVPVFLVHLAKSTPRDVHCELQFAYGNAQVELEGPDVLPEPDGETWLLRDEDAEATQINTLLGLIGDDMDPTGLLGYLTVPRKKLSAVLTRVVDAGIRVLADGKPFVRYQSVRVSVQTGIDWFDVQGAIDFAGGVSLPLAKALLAAKKGERFVELGNGQTGVLPDEWLERWASVLELGEASADGGVRLRSSQALLLDALLSARGAAEITTDKGYRALKKRLANFAGVAPRAEPEGFHGTLRPYQQLGLGWLHFLRDLGLGGCLADDMGLGKTVQVLALLQDVHAARNVRPSLLVVPRSLLDNWQREAARFTPVLRVALFTGVNRWERIPPARLAEHDLVVTTYGTLRADAARFEQEQMTFEYAILDEAQAVENDASVTSKAVRLLRSKHRLAMTGTPVQNHLGELWALFEFLSPGLLGRSAVFQKLVGGGKKGARLDGKLLHKALAPFLLRRTKEQVLPELPEKQEQLLVCDLEGTQRAAYDALRSHYRALLGNGGAALDNKERFVALEALLRLRQAACHEGLIDKKLAARPAAKLDALLPMLREIAESGHKALVFSQFVGFLEIVRAGVEGLGLSYEYLDGSTRDRQARVDRFQGDPACAVFLISLKAGGFGLNLTAADYVFVLDPWWNPAAEAQAIDRTHRIGQLRKVTAYRLVARDTVEEKVLQLQAEKRALVEAVLGSDGGLLRGMTREDLLGLIG